MLQQGGDQEADVDKLTTGNSVREDDAETKEDPALADGEHPDDGEDVRSDKAFKPIEVQKCDGVESEANTFIDTKSDSVGNTANLFLSLRSFCRGRANAGFAAEVRVLHIIATKCPEHIFWDFEPPEGCRRDYLTLLMGFLQIAGPSI